MHNVFLFCLSKLPFVPLLVILFLSRLAPLQLPAPPPTLPATQRLPFSLCIGAWAWVRVGL